MYKSRFQEWGVEKNSSAGRILSQTEKMCLHGKELDKTMGYLRRLSQPRRKEILDALKPLLVNNPVSLQAPLSPPDEIFFPERCIKELRSYVRQCHQSGLWPRDSLYGFKFEDVVPAWCSSPWQAAGLLKEGKTDKANRLLSRFATECRGQLERHDPLIFPYIYSSVLYFSGRFPPYATRLLAVIHRASKALLRGHPAHPLHTLIEILTQIGPQNMLHFGSRILLAYIDYVEESLGEAWPIVLEMLADTIDRLVFYNMMEPQEALKVGYRMILAAELQDHGRSQSILELKMALSLCHLRMARYSEGIQVLEDVLESHDPTRHSSKMLVSLHMQMAKLHDGDGEQSRALESAVRAVQTSIQEFGEVAGWTINSLRLLHDMREKVGHTEHAQKVMQDYDYLIEKMCS